MAYTIRPPGPHTQNEHDTSAYRGIDDRYDHNYFAWLEARARELRQAAQGEEEVLELDLENLAEKIEGLARVELKALKSRLARVAKHLMKWQFQPERRSLSWNVTIVNDRNEIEDDLQSQALRNKITDAVMGRIFRWIRNEALAETELPEAAIPQGMLYAMDELANRSFLPGVEIMQHD